MVVRKLSMVMCLIFSLFMSVPSFSTSVYANEYNKNAYQTFLEDGSLTQDKITDEVVEGFFSETGGGSAKEKRAVKSLMYQDDGQRVEQYSQCSEESKRKVRDKILSFARSTYTKGKVNQIGTDFNVQADISGAATSLEGLRPILSWISGIVLVTIVLLASVITALDIAFISIPPIRFHLDEIAESNGKLRKDTKDGGSKFRFVSDAAVLAVKNATIENGKSAIWEYIKKRVVEICFIGLAIFILATGNVDIIVNIMITIAGYLLEVLSTFAN